MLIDDGGGGGLNDGTIEEEVEDVDEDRERERALRKLSGDEGLSLSTSSGAAFSVADSPPFLPLATSSPGGPSVMARHGLTTIFTAHKSRNVFGPPLSVLSSGGRKHAPHSPLPQTSSTASPLLEKLKLRDVFSADDEWVDEEEYVGGFGQTTSSSVALSPGSAGPSAVSTSRHDGGAFAFAEVRHPGMVGLGVAVERMPISQMGGGRRTMQSPGGTGGGNRCVNTTTLRGGGAVIEEEEEE
jgi:hypothetical protein